MPILGEFAVRELIHAARLAELDRVETYHAVKMLPSGEPLELLIEVREDLRDDPEVRSAPFTIRVTDENGQRYSGRAAPSPEEAIACVDWNDIDRS